VLLDLTEVG
jgi:hypothetical protein